MFRRANKFSEEQKMKLMDDLKRSLPDSTHTLLVKGGEEGVTPATLERWLVARSWNVEAASRDLQTHAEWRSEYVPHGRIPEVDVESSLKQGKVYIQGRDKYGRGFIYLQISKHAPEPAEKIARFIAYCLDAAISLGDPVINPTRKVVGVFDCRGMTTKNLDFVGLRSVFEVLQNHYPERLGKLYLYCAPTILLGLFKLVEPFIDPETRKKVVFVYASNSQAALDDFHPEVLPSVLGGFAALKPAQEAWQELLVTNKSPEATAVTVAA